ncbi:MAG TPA: hypothetical protein VK901_19190, partial [Nitrospiraceae bacterium]|nr:hypothetical protein [Nitrospiraceae bacterium]
MKYKYIRMLPLVAGLMLGAGNLAFADATFTVNDTPGYWFDMGKDITGTGSRSLAIIGKNEKVTFNQKVESRHTVTSLVWPKNAPEFAPGRGVLDQEAANQAQHEVTLTEPGLYVFVCKLHPYMLGAVIVDDPNTTDGNGGPAYDLGGELKVLGGPSGLIGPFPTYSDLGLRLLRAFFIVTSPSNWKDYTKVGTPYQPTYPHVVVNVGGTTTAYLDNAILAKGYDGKVIEKQRKPHKNGIGEVWVDTQFELSAGKPESTPGTATVVSATDWNVKRKIALPEQKMNNGHNFWTSHDQKQIYQTEWHGNSVYVLNRHNGKLLQEIDLVNGPEVKDPKFNGKKCYDPAHVMTRVDTQQVHVGCNGDDNVVEFDRNPVTGLLSIHQFIPMSKNPGVDKQTQPHAHWMGFDGL